MGRAAPCSPVEHIFGLRTRRSLESGRWNFNLMWNNRNTYARFNALATRPPGFIPVRAHAMCSLSARSRAVVCSPGPAPSRERGESEHRREHRVGGYQRQTLTVGGRVTGCDAAVCRRTGRVGSRETSVRGTGACRGEYVGRVVRRKSSMNRLDKSQEARGDRNTVAQSLLAINTFKRTHARS